MRAFLNSTAYNKSRQYKKSKEFNLLMTGSRYITTIK